MNQATQNIIPDAAAERAARDRQRILTKPPGALGTLEDIACWFAARQRTPIAAALVPAITVFAADHGVAAEGVSAYPSEVTSAMVRNFAAGGAAINVLARAHGATLSVVDVGVASVLDGVGGIVNAKVRFGTQNLMRERAMSRSEVEHAMDVGRQRAAVEIDQGANLLIAGEMGIGNTTASACLICAFTGADPELVVGVGTGVDAAGRRRKIHAVESALARLKQVDLDAIGIMAEVGGLEIAAISGYYLEGAARGVPLLLDGFISGAAAIAAAAIDASVKNWLIASHLSSESGHGIALDALQLRPLVDLGLRLGEGSGAALVLPILQAALRLHAEMATFDEAGIAPRND